jgi:outer membrane lipoprotein SlyB
MNLLLQRGGDVNKAACWARLIAAVGVMSLCAVAAAQSNVTYGRITAVNLINTDSASARAAGTIVGGGLGLIATRNQSGSTQALAGVGGALAGRQIGNMASRGQAFEYTILLGGTTTATMVTDEGGFRIGDCVAVERGTFNNMRLVDDSRCAQNVRASVEAVQHSDQCIAAKNTLLLAETDEEFDRAERRVRLLCRD